MSICGGYKSIKGAVSAATAGTRGRAAPLAKASSLALISIRRCACVSETLSAFRKKKKKNPRGFVDGETFFYSLLFFSRRGSLKEIESSDSLKLAKSAAFLRWPALSANAFSLSLAALCRETFQ